MERTGFEVRGWGFGKVIGLALLLSTNAMILSAAPQASKTGQGLRITVRVYDYARVMPETLRQAEEEATRIFHLARVDLEWLDCPTSVEEASKYPACEPPLGAMAVDLRILPQSMASRLRSGREQLGFALPSAHPGRASAAWVFFHRVEELAASKDASRSQILGIAIAHEVGHLLLGPDRHSDHGIMRANWGRRDLQEAARGQQFFTTEQGERIRAEVRARMGQSDSLRTSASGSLR
jgi:hypothetical protein